MLDAPPDGYTLGVIGNGQAIAMSLFKRRPYHVLTDFTFVSITARFEMLLAVKADSPLKAPAGCGRRGAEESGKAQFRRDQPWKHAKSVGASFAAGERRECRDRSVQDDARPATAVLRGDVDVGSDFYAGLQAVISDNQVRIIATSGEERNPLLRDVPTAKESGFPEYIVTSWNGLAAAAGLPADTLAALNQHINVALSDPALQSTAAKLGMDARGSTPQDMRERMAADVQKWAAVIEEAGIEKQ